MKYVFNFCILWFFLAGCNDDRLLDAGDQRQHIRAFEKQPFEVITLPGVDRLSIGGVFEEVIRTEEEYDRLVYERFQKPLNDYCNDWFPDLRRELEQRYPESSPEEIQQMLNRKCMARAPVFEGLEKAEHPEIDFNNFTLLGQDAHASGCRKPDYDISLKKDNYNHYYEFRVLITQHGYCDMAINRNLWILAPAIPETGEVVFEKEYEFSSTPKEINADNNR